MGCRERLRWRFSSAQVPHVKVGVSCTRHKAVGVRRRPGHVADRSAVMVILRDTQNTTSSRRVHHRQHCAFPTCNVSRIGSASSSTFQITTSL